MLKNYFKIALRNIQKNKVYTIINILGLALGICACIVIYLISNYEFSFDDFHPGKKSIYRIMGDVMENTGNKLHFGRLPIGVSEYGRRELTGIDFIAGVIPYDADIAVLKKNKIVNHFESHLKATHYITTVISHPEYFSVFKYQWLAGNAATALNAPLKVVLTESRAKQYFGNVSMSEIIGRQINYNDSLNVTISGIVKDWAGNTDLGFTDFISAATLQTNFLQNNINTTSWATPDMNTWTFVKLSASTPVTKLNMQLNTLVKRYATSDKLALSPEPLSDVHFDENVIENQIRTADKPTLYELIAIALFILVLAIINFINLSTAQSFYRSKEVGVRKVLGSNRAGLVLQFLTETLVLTLFAVLLAAFLVNPVLTIFHSFIPVGVVFNLFEPSVIIFLVGTILITTLLAGLYPAKVLSSHMPVTILKGSATQTGNDKWLLRKGLIVFQFSVSLVFIIGSIVITKQLKYARDKNPGFNANAIVNIDAPRDDSLSKISVLVQKIKELPGISNVALQWVPPMALNGRGHAIKINSYDVKETGVTQVAGDENFIPLYQIKLLAGRNLMHADSMKEIIINESLSKLMGYRNPADAINKTVYWDNKPFPVVGVVQDFHSRSFHELISPLCIVNRPDREATIAVKLITNNIHSSTIKTTLSQIEQEWKQIYPQVTFNYRFYDESLAMMYQKDQQTAMLVNTSMAITIFISCIGLFGLILFTAQKRAKEISIRKILGASVVNIFMLLSKDFAVMIIIALLIASPVAWYYTNSWLQSFAYRINIEWWFFMIAGAAAILIAIITISFQAIKAAIANPVKSLRTE